MNDVHFVGIGMVVAMRARSPLLDTWYAPRYARSVTVRVDVPGRALDVPGRAQRVWTWARRTCAWYVCSGPRVRAHESMALLPRCMFHYESKMIHNEIYMWRDCHE